MCSVRKSLCVAGQTPHSVICFSIVLGRPSAEGVREEDIDELQWELESMLSALFARQQRFQNEMQAMHNS